MSDRQKIMSDLEGLTFDDWHMFHCDSDVQGIAIDAMNLLKEQPEQKHGHWKLVQDYYDDEHWQCSACGCEWYLEAGNPKENNMHYCPECGAKMDEEVDEQCK